MAGESQHLYQLIFGGWIQQSLSVAAKLGIPDLLKESPKSHEQLAIETKTHAPTLYRLLRALSSTGIFKELDNKCFENGPLGVFLQTDIKGSARAIAIMVGEEWDRNSWSNLLHAVQTGEPAFRKTYGIPFFDYLSENQEAGEIFNNAMSGLSKVIGPTLEIYDFSPFNKIIDIGGGHGRLMEAILCKNPHVTGAIYDLPVVIEGTKTFIQSVGLENRCECIAGSFFDSVPVGADAYILRSIIHDWSDEESIKILQHCRQGILDHGKIILIENVIKTDSESDPFLNFVDLEMAVLLTGKERTEAEFRELFEKAGFKLSKIVPTPMNNFIIEGIPV